MKIKEKQQIIDYCNTLSNEELEKFYYRCIYDCLGSVSERMIELDYDYRDIEEAQRMEKYYNEKSDVVEEECHKRGIELWK